MSIEELETRVEELASRLQIEQQLHRWTRGADRIDLEMMRSVFHPCCNINYGFFSGPAEEFLQWVVKFHADELVSTSHVIVNLIVRIDDDRAFSEAPVNCCLRYKSAQGLSDLLIVGRYLDKWERSDGIWRISDRLTLVDRYSTQPVEQSPDADRWMTGVNLGLRSKSDPSYGYV